MLRGFFDVLLGEDRRARCDAANDRQATVIGFGFEAGDTNAAGGARGHFDGAFAGQRFQMFFGSIGRLEAQLLSDLGAGRRIAVVFEAALDEVQNLGLAWRQFVMCIALAFYTVTGIIYSAWVLAMVLFAGACTSARPSMATCLGLYG